MRYLIVLIKIIFKIFLNFYLKNIRVIFKKNYLINFNPNKIISNKKALLFYKYSGNLSPKTGSTEYQSITIANILNELGYIVTIVDRSARPKLNKKYDLIIGIFNTASGNYFYNYVKKYYKNSKIIGISTGAHPLIMKREFEIRRRYFFARNKVNLRNKLRHSNGNIIELIDKFDSIIYHGYNKQFVHRSYSNFQIKKFNVITPISDKLEIKEKDIKNKKINKTNFLFYSVSGFLHKGLDLVIEYFIKNPKLNLYICCTNLEIEYIHFYNLNKYKNIKVIGKINEFGDRAKAIFNSCSFYICPSCTGGSSASTAVAMRYGLIPIVSIAEDSNFQYSITIKKCSSKNISESINTALSFNDKKIKYLSLQNFLFSFENTGEKYYEKMKYSIKKTI